MSETKRRQDPIDNALRKVRKVEWMTSPDGLQPDAADEQALKDCRAACTALLRLTPEQRQKVLAAAEALSA